MTLEKKHKCWITDTEECVHADVETCELTFRQYAIVVFCDDTKCMWNILIPKEKKYVKHNKDHTPFPADYAKGICGRKEIHVLPKDFLTKLSRFHVSSCSTRSDKGISGHMDFSRLLKPDGTVYGGSIESQNVDPEEYRNFADDQKEQKWI